MSDALSVAIDSTPLLGLRTGIGQVVAELIRALQRLPAAPSVVPYTLSWRARQMRTSLPPDTRFVPIPARVLLPSWARAELPRIDRWLRPARVIHATNFLTPPSRLPTLVTIHDCSFVRFPELCTPEVRAMAPIVRRAVQRGATLHTTSQFVADEIEEFFGRGLHDQRRLVVIPFGIPDVSGIAEMPMIVQQRCNGAPFVLALGTLEPRKNLPLLVTAFGAVANAQPDLHLVLAGADGAARADVDAAISRLDQRAASRVVRTGPVSDSGRRALLGHASLVAYPSIYEGFGFPVLEAMTLGVPVVAARAGAIPEVAGDAALLVEPTDVDELASAITRLLVDDSLRRALIARGHDRAARFSWHDTARALADCYRMLTDAQSARS